MKNKIFSLSFLIFLTGSLSAQSLKETKKESKATKVENPSLTFPNDYTKGRQISKQNPLSGFKTINLHEGLESDFKIKHQDGDQIKWLTGNPDISKGLSIDQKINSWFSKASKILKINPEKTTYGIINTETDKTGNQHCKVQQYHNGIKVYNGEMIVHLKDNSIYQSNGSYTPSGRLPEFDLSSVMKEEKVKSDIIQKVENFQNDHLTDLKDLGININVQQWKNEIVYYNHNSDYKLAYYIQVYPHLAEQLVYFVDAFSGEVLKQYSNICKSHHHHHDSCGINHAHTTEVPKNKKEFSSSFLLDGEAQADARDLLGQTRRINTYDVGGTFFMIDASRDMHNSVQSNFPNDAVGVIWTIDMNDTSPQSNGDFTHVVSNNNSWSGSPEGVSAHYNAGQAYEYFKNVHGRESISGDGQNIISFVNVANEDGSSMGGAFWNGIGIHYGNGDSKFLEAGRGLDVSGHEMTHGVIQATANLDYYAEPGAINESYADIFGAMIDRDDWLMGEDITKNGRPLRNMMDPHNGAPFGDFRNDWQPRHYSERYTGELDNAGVHINSGIPNRAYYLFATATSKEIAEKVYYHALTRYLTRSSQFKDLRYAVVESAGDLYGTNVVNAAKSAFDEVGIADQGTTSYEEDIDSNPGDDLLLLSDKNLDQLFIINLTQQNVPFDPLTSVGVSSKPSITDDGTNIVFVGKDNLPYLIELDWSTNPPTKVSESTLSTDPIWKNIIVSKDGSRFAAIFSEVTPIEDSQNREVYVIDRITGDDQIFELYNPTFSEGIRTGSVLYADAMEFDVTGNYILYDANNSVSSSTGADITFWDIGFLEVWNPQSNTWALGNIQKLFSQLDEGESVGNPTFSKNSPYIIAMDYLDSNESEPTVDILGVNYERGEIGTIFENTVTNYPTYSVDDRQMVFDYQDPNSGFEELAIINLEDDKINGIVSTAQLMFGSQFESQWGVWFSNGQRVLSDTEEVLSQGTLDLSPNPASDFLNVNFDKSTFSGELTIEIHSVDGKLIKKIAERSTNNSISIPIGDLMQGSYILSVRDSEQLVSQKFIKQ